MWTPVIDTPRQRLAWEVAFLVPVTVAVAVLGACAAVDVTCTVILTVVFACTIAARFLLVNAPGDWIFFLFGIVAGGGNDLMSMANGVYAYTSIPLLPFLQGLMPAWNVAFWGQVFLLFRKVFNVDWFAGEPFQPAGTMLRGWVSWRLVIDLAILVVLRLIVYTWFMDPVVPGTLYGLIVGARILAGRPRRNELLIIAILPYAFMFEGLMVTFGLYVYHNPVFLGMPAWLLLWWVFLVPFLFKHLFDMIEHALARPRGKGVVPAP